jgi:hypothetical protein
MVHGCQIGHQGGVRKQSLAIGFHLVVSPVVFGSDIHQRKLRLPEHQERGDTAESGEGNPATQRRVGTKKL